MPAVSEPLDRHARLRRRRRALRERRRRRELQLRRLRPGRQSRTNPCGDPPAGARRLRRRRRPPRAARCAARTCARRATRVPGRHAAPRRPGDRGGAARQPALRPAPTPTRAASSPTGSAIPFRVRGASRHERDLDRRRGLEHLGGDRPARRHRRRRSRTSAGRATRVLATAAAATTHANLDDLREPLRGRPEPVHGPALLLQPRRPGRPRRRLSDGQLVGHRDRLLRANGGYPSEYDGALFFADYSRNCIWAMLPGADGVPDPAERA